MAMNGRNGGGRIRVEDLLRDPLVKDPQTGHWVKRSTSTGGVMDRPSRKRKAVKRAT